VFLNLNGEDERESARGRGGKGYHRPLTFYTKGGEGGRVQLVSVEKPERRVVAVRVNQGTAGSVYASGRSGVDLVKCSGDRRKKGPGGKVRADRGEKPRRSCRRQVTRWLLREKKQKRGKIWSEAARAWGGKGKLPRRRSQRALPERRSVGRGGRLTI